MEPQKPSVGRIVHFNAPNGDYIVQEAALIVGVNSETSVNLVSWNSMGTSSTRTSVPFGSVEKAGTWSWPARV